MNWAFLCNEIFWIGAGSIGTILSVLFVGQSIRLQSKALNLNSFYKIHEDIVNSEIELNKIMNNKKLGKIKKEKLILDWDMLFLNKLESYSFLFNAKLIKNKKMILYFKDVLKFAYEDILSKNHYNSYEDKKQFEELKSLYFKLNKK